MEEKLNQNFLLYSLTSTEILSCNFLKGEVDKLILI